MKTRSDLVRGWLLKAEGDLANARLYDLEFWPSAEVTRQALDAALTIRSLVVDRLPKGMRPK